MAAALVLVRLAAFGAGVVLFGAPLFVLYGRLADHIAAKRLRRLLITAAAVFAAASAAALVLQTGQMAGDPAAGLDPATLREVITAGGFGASILARIGATLLVLGLLATLKLGRRLWAAVAGLGAVGLAALAWAGHGAADEGLAGLAHTTADVIHLLAVGVWLGALLMLLVQLFDRTANVEALRRALRGFSGLGSIVVGVILASGLVNCWFLVGISHVSELAVGPPASRQGRAVRGDAGLCRRKPILVDAAPFGGASHRPARGAGRAALERRPGERHGPRRARPRRRHRRPPTPFGGLRKCRTAVAGSRAGGPQIRLSVA